MKNKSLYLTILLTCLLLSMSADRGKATASSDSAIVVGELGMYVFTALRLPNYETTDFDHQGLFNWNMHLQITYPVRCISPQLNLRFAEYTPHEKRPGVFWKEVESPNREFKKVFINFFSVTTSLNFRQNITSYLDISYLAGMNFSIFQIERATALGSR